MQQEYTSQLNAVKNSVKSANWHFTSTCNYRCTFCSVQKMQGDLRSMVVAKRTLEDLKRLGILKINYVGGEPLCNPLIYPMVKMSKDLGFVNSIVSNGALLNEKSLDSLAPYVDWIGLSVDSASDEVEAKLGRGRGGHVAHALEIVSAIIDRGIKLKINSTVTRLSVNEDMSGLIGQLKPDRWKVFQFMHVPGQNDHCVNDLAITATEFDAFKERHAGVTLMNGLKPVYESEDMMLESYLMISPSGKLFMNNKYPYEEYDMSTMTTECLQEIMNVEMYHKRGAIYDWNGN